MGICQRTLVIALAMATTGCHSDSGDSNAPSTGANSPQTQPDFGPTDPFADSINKCERRLVTSDEVESALGFRPTEPASRIPASGVFPGCEYVTPSRERGGRVVITAFTTDAPPIPWERTKPVEGLGDAAEFTLFGNNDVHWVRASEGAMSMLQVRNGDVIIRLNAGRFDIPEQTFRPFGLPALRRLAEVALTTLDEGQ